MCDVEYSTVVAGGLHTCLVAADGRAFCWGGNDQGQLGVGGFDLYERAYDRDTRNNEFRISTSGPVFRKILSYLLQKYAVPPTNTRPAHLPVEW